ncbi:MAG TPA: S8 family serine peptidase, partial [Chloroflexota bacterium]|nr:S8 family serine peptidase [Chloroflexota bacterium]
ASCQHVVAVASTDSNDTKSSLSTFGPWVHVAAPGGVNALAHQILSTSNTGGYVEMQGTSMAAPVVSGVAALLWASSYGTSSQAVVNRLFETADPVAGTGSSWAYGRINAAAAVSAPQPSPTATETPTATPTATASATSTATTTLTATATASATPTLTPTSTPTSSPTPQSASASFWGRIAFLGRGPAPNSSWQTTVQLSFQQSHSSAVPTTASATTDTSGEFVVPNLQPGTYDVQLKMAQGLSKLAPGVVLSPGNNPALDFGQVAVGDINGDDAIDLLDFSMLRTTFGKCDRDTGYDARADLNGDGCVDLLDFSLLRVNFGRFGPLLVP